MKGEVRPRQSLNWFDGRKGRLTWSFELSFQSLEHLVGDIKATVFASFGSFGQGMAVTVRGWKSSVGAPCL